MPVPLLIELVQAEDIAFLINKGKLAVGIRDPGCQLHCLSVYFIISVCRVELKARARNFLADLIHLDNLTFRHGYKIVLKVHV